MSLFVASLNSGSNGNCYYIGNQDEAVLIDGGISCRETERRMRRLGLAMKKVKALFVSHEHSDHISGVTRLSKKYRLPVYITSHTLDNGHLRVSAELAMPFKAYAPIAVGSLTVTAFPKFHDASDPHSFIISGSGVTIGVFTDIGAPCDHVIRHFEQCHAAFLESNYDEDLLETGRYPLHLKKRIREGQGHLSNRQARQLFVDHRPSFMSHLFLSHLSRDNNSPKIVRSLFDQVAGATEIIIASRYRESRVYHIRNIPGFAEKAQRRVSRPSEVQLTLF